MYPIGASANAKKVNSEGLFPVYMALSPPLFTGTRALLNRGSTKSPLHAGLPCRSLPCWTSPTLLAVVRVIVRLLGRGSLLGGLLLLALALLLARVPGQGLLKDLENLLIRDLLVRLELAHVERRGPTELGDAVLGDGYDVKVSNQLS